MRTMNGSSSTLVPVKKFLEPAGFGLPNFSKSKVMVIGDIILDRYCLGPTKVSEECPTLAVTVTNVQDRLGGATNVALNIASLLDRTHVALLGYCGIDEPAVALNNLLKKVNNISVNLIHLENYTTIMKLRVMSGSQQLVRLDYENSKTVLAEIDHETLVAKCHRILFCPEAAAAAPNVLILSDYQHGSVTAAQQLIQIAKANNVKVLVDPLGSDIERFRGATLVKPNHIEFQDMIGRPYENQEDMMQSGMKLLHQYDWEALLITLAEDGMMLLRKDNAPFHIPSTSENVVDVNGAGDTVIAVLAASLSAGSELKDACMIANAAAGIVVMKSGTAVCSIDELKSVLNNRHEIDKSPIIVSVSSRSELVTLVRRAQSKGQKVVMTNGCFDILHVGHVTFLEEASQLGDQLIVAVNSDESVRKNKGIGRPINSLQARMKILSSLKFIDRLISFDELTSESIIADVAPDVLVKGGDYKTIEDIVGHETVLGYGGEVRLLSMVDGCSTTAIMDNIRLQK